MEIYLLQLNLALLPPAEEEQLNFVANGENYGVASYMPL
jgi:hypothetical protein